MGTLDRVLIVDDEPADRWLLADALGEGNFQHVEAENGFDALRRVIDDDYQAIVLDLKMPGMDGFGFLQAVEKEKPWMLKRVIVVTGGGRDSFGRVEKKVYSVIRKPFPIPDLVETVRQCIGTAA